MGGILVFTLLQFAVGVALLIGGAWALVAGSSRLAERLGIPSLLVGLTVVAWGTSAPEFFVSVAAAIQGSPDIMLGNIIGSNLANIGLVLGLALLFLKPTVDAGFWRRELWFLLAATALFAFLLADGTLGRIDGAVMLLAFVGYSIQTVLHGLDHARDHKASHPGGESRAKGLPLNLLLIIGGVAGLYAGSHWIVLASVKIAAALDVPQMIVGWTLVAIGTSLPEMAATLAAAVRRDSGIALGNVVGSNLFNLLAVGGPVALIDPVHVEPGFLGREYLGLAVMTGLFWVPLLGSGRFARLAGGLFLLFLYALILARRFGLDLGV